MMCFFFVSNCIPIVRTLPNIVFVIRMGDLPDIDRYVPDAISSAVNRTDQANHFITPVYVPILTGNITNFLFLGVGTSQILPYDNECAPTKLS